MHTSECDRISLLIAASLDGVATSVDADALDEHLDSCALCRETFLTSAAGGFEGDALDDVTEQAVADDAAAMLRWTRELDRPNNALAIEPAGDESREQPMFTNYIGARTPQPSRLRSTLIAASIAVHAALLIGLVVRGAWVVDRLIPPKRMISQINSIEMARLPAETTPEVLLPAVAPRPPAGPGDRPNRAKKSIVRDRMAQPARQTDDLPGDGADSEIAVYADVYAESEDDPAAESGGNGVPGGVAGGIPGGVVGGRAGGSLQGIPGCVLEAMIPPAPPKPLYVPHVAIEQKRTAGETNILPDEETKARLNDAGLPQLDAVVEMCLSKKGHVRRLRIVKSTEYPAYDRKIRREMNQWNYRPYLLDGKPVAVCTMVTIIYRAKRRFQKSSVPKPTLTPRQR